ncbi:hypothetical protein ACHAXR_002346 [Thalassiosira sp. AJA248-18]
MPTIVLLVGAAMASVSMALTFPSLSPLRPKMVMLDRDGVINQDVGSPGVIHKDQFHLTPGAANAIGKLKRSGCLVVIITNQSCVGKGLLGMSDLGSIHDKMEQLLVEGDSCAVIDRIYVCTSVDENDPRKKPNPGMIIEACHDMQVDPANSVFIGDTLTDLQAAKLGRVPRRVLVETGYGFGLMGGVSACVPAKVVEGTYLDTCNGCTLSQHLFGVMPFLYASNLEEAVISIIGDNGVS